MDTIITTDGRIIHDKWMKRLRIVAYLLIGAAGLLLTYSPVIQSELGIIGLTMAGFLAVGGTCCTLGQVLNRWIGEYIGIPLVASSFAVFGIITFAGNLTAAPYIAWANLAILVGVSFSLLARWRQVHAVYRMAVRLQPREQ